MMRLLPRRRLVPATGSALLTNLISYWKLDEASGNALDAHGSNTLTESAAIGTGTGKINGARSFSGVEALSIADNASLSTGDIDFTIAAWCRYTSFIDYMMIAAKRDGTDGEWALTRDTTGAFLFEIRGSAGFGDPVTVTSITPTTATWYFVIGWHNSAANTINIQVDDGTVFSAAATLGVFDSAAPFYIGNDAFLNGHDGLIDEVGFWKRVLTAGERTSLYNSGAGKAYSTF